MIEILEQRMFLNAPGANWQPVFVDEFDGNSLDTNKWRLYLPWTSSYSGDNRFHNTNYLSYMMPDDVAVSDGTLKLTTQKRTVTSANGRVFDYTEGMITSNATFWSQYGYFEIRASLPTGAGNWPAFWTLANGWPPEDDIMEVWTTTNRSHQGLYNMAGQWDDYNTYTALPTGWHTWAMEWGPNYQKFYIDGTLRYTVQDTGNVPNIAQYMLLNSGVASGQVANYSNANNNTLQVDYVRVYGYNAAPGPALTNADFETGSSAAGWSRYGTTSVVTTGQRTGVRALQLSGANSGAEQTITGLQPNTAYTISGYVSASSGNTGYVGVKNYGGSQLLQGVSSSGYSRAAVTFTTGASSTSAVVFCYKPAGTGGALFDDLNFHLTPLINPIDDQTTAAGTPLAVSMSMTNVGGKATFYYSATSSNTTLLPNANIAFSNNGPTPTITLTPAANQRGTTQVTVTATDPWGAVDTETFVLNVVTGISGTAGDDTIRLVRNGSFVDVFINNSSPTPTAQYDYATAGAFDIKSLGGDDTITLDFIAGSIIPSGGIAIDAGTQSRTDKLVVIGSGGNDAVAVGQGVMSFNGGSATHSGVEDVRMDLGGGADTLGATGAAMTTQFSLTVSGSLTLTAPLPVGTDVTMSGGTLDLNGQPQVVDLLVGAGAVQLGGASLSVGAANSIGVYSGSITGSGNVTKVGNGAWTLGGTCTYTGQTSAQQGTLRVDGSITAGSTVTASGSAMLLIGAPQTWASLQVADTAQVRLTAGGTNVLTTTILTIGGSGKLDVNDNALIVDYEGSSPLAAITAAIASGRAAGSWNGVGIHSSTAAADATKSLGVAEASELNLQTFAGRQIDDTAVLVRLTWAGDADLDGDVDISDLGSLASHWQSAANWARGDFNYDQTVDISDLGILASNWQAGVAPAPGPASSPRARINTWKDRPILMLADTSVMETGQHGLGKPMQGTREVVRDARISILP